MTAAANVVRFPVESQRVLVEIPGGSTGLPYLPEIRRKRAMTAAAERLKSTPPHVFMVSKLFLVMSHRASKADIQTLRWVEELLAWDIVNYGKVDGIEAARKHVSTLGDEAERTARERRKSRKRRKK